MPLHVDECRYNNAGSLTTLAAHLRTFDTISEETAPVKLQIIHAFAGSLITSLLERGGQEKVVSHRRVL